MLLKIHFILPLKGCNKKYIVTFHWHPAPTPEMYPRRVTQNEESFH